MLDELLTTIVYKKNLQPCLTYIFSYRHKVISQYHIVNDGRIEAHPRCKLYSKSSSISLPDYCTVHSISALFQIDYLIFTETVSRDSDIIKKSYVFFFDSRCQRCLYYSIIHLAGGCVTLS